MWQTAATKTEAIVADHRGESLDELVASKKINADQKAQLEKKPSLLAEKARLEDQIVHYRKFGKEYEERFAKEKADLEESYAEAVAKLKLEAADEAVVTARKRSDEDLLVISQFLHAAAAKRQDEDIDADEKAAFEGVLLLVYQGNNAALTAFRDVVTGSDKRVSNTEGDEIAFTYAQVKEIAMRDAPPSWAEEPTTTTTTTTNNTTITTTANGVPGNETGAVNGTNDPTIAHAGFSERNDDGQIPNIGEIASAATTLVQPAQSSIPLDAANAAAEQSWDAQASMGSDNALREDGWVEVPRDPAETETGVTATPAAMHGSNNWAEEVNADAAAHDHNHNAKAAPENDGFEQVIHHQPRARGRGQRGDFRGRGFRGGGSGGGDGRGYRGRGDGGRFRGDSDRRGGGGGGGGRGRGRGGVGSGGGTDGAGYGNYRGGSAHRGSDSVGRGRREGVSSEATC